jgi:hypothetical protein
MLVLFVAASKTHFEEQVLVADTKQAGRLQGWQANRAVGLACFALYLLLVALFC